ncbi:MAG: hypothetical protein Q9160_002409 [Pyrenula sp. 1 TL-2023]
MDTPRTAKIGGSRSSNAMFAAYPRAHLLSIPYDIRRQIWDTIHAWNSADSTFVWFERPTNLWEGLDSTCKQVQDEISDLWPKSKLNSSTAADRLLFYDFLSPTALRGLSRLSLEVSRDKDINYYETIGAALQYLNPYLRELRLFFVAQLSKLAAHHECVLEQGSHCQLERSPPDFKNIIVKTPLFDAITLLSQISLLVVANADTAINIGTLITAKPCLTHLRVSTDPRLSYDNRLGYKTRIPSKDLRVVMPPLRKLHLTANAVSRSLELFKGAIDHLEDVAWTVSSKAHELHSFGFMKCTASLINILRRAPNLSTFRIYLDDPIDEDLASHEDFIAAIRYKLPLFRKLRTFEFHGKHADLSGSYFFGREIIAQGLPDSVERFYTSESLIPADVLKDSVNERYLKADGSLGFVSARGRLGFVGYHYDASGKVKSERTKMTLLTFNGRLLDRERYVKKKDQASSAISGPHERSSILLNPLSEAPKPANTNQAPSGTASTFGSLLFVPVTPIDIDSWLFDSANVADKPSQNDVETSHLSGLEESEVRRWVEEAPVTEDELPRSTWPDDVAVEESEGQWMS